MSVISLRSGSYRYITVYAFLVLFLGELSCVLVSLRVICVSVSWGIILAQLCLNDIFSATYSW